MLTSFSVKAFLHPYHEFLGKYFQRPELMTAT